MPSLLDNTAGSLGCGVDELAFLPATEQARLVREREVSPVELVETYLERIERLDPELGAYVTVCARRGAGRRAGEVRASRAEAPFHGVPISLKDLDIDRPGSEPRSPAKRSRPTCPISTLAHVARLKAAGFVVLGKTNTPEFGTTAFTDSALNGPCRTPWDLSRNAGGSSGGAGAALAAGLCAIASGSDGGGSIRIPASCCGVLGFKASRGRVSSAPLVPGIGLGTAGPLRADDRRRRGVPRRRVRLRMGRSCSPPRRPSVRSRRKSEWIPAGCASP